MGRRAYSDFAWEVRGAYIYPLVFFSAIVLQSSSRSQQQAKVFLDTSSYFHAHETVAFVSICHIYVPIAPCSRAKQLVVSASTQSSIVASLTSSSADKPGEAELKTP